jgi:hypothetical protein
VRGNERKDEKKAKNNKIKEKEGKNYETRECICKE